ncbi:MAG: hypothetical protein J1F20_06320 [Muribaculaceae bacterium]|nr:hypothetical protein [Muribaculaceae bacterium]
MGKSTVSSIAAISFLFSFFLTPCTSKACGPFRPLIPTPDFFTPSSFDRVFPERDYDREENLLLWQQLTSPDIPLSDIEEAVYTNSLDKVYSILEWPGIPTDNLFYTYILNKRDDEIKDFLLLAKRLENHRKTIASPWYYPEKYNYDNSDNNFQYVFNWCKSYRGARLKDRYGLQAVRAHFANRNYDKCIKFFDEYFVNFPDTNLFKRMSMKYVAGCWERLGEKEKADELYIRAGYFWETSSPNAFQHIADRYPDSPLLWDYVRYCSKDSLIFCRLQPAVEQILNNKNVKCRGEWEYALAYMKGKYHKDYKAAAKHIRRAMQSKFSDPYTLELARAYQTKIDAINGNMSHLVRDLQWFEKKMDLLNPDADKWSRRLQNIVYENWIPTLWEKRQYTTAILLCGYVENFLRSSQYFNTGWFSYDPNLPDPSFFEHLSLDEVRSVKKASNFIDYGSLSFQLMNTLTASQLIKVQRELKANTPLYTILRKYARTDEPYFDELIGTLALREENYSLAMKYLEKVPVHYQQTTNIYDYLKKDPFYYHPCLWEFPSDDIVPTKYKFDFTSPQQYYESPDNAKYNFAKRMQQYKTAMIYGKTADERGLARIMYAIGRWNSYENCWALTQYWRGENCNLFYPHLYYIWPTDGFDKYDFLYDYSSYEDYQNTQRIFDEEVEKGMAMLVTDEAKAIAEYIFGNVKTVIKRYPDTPTAATIRKSCDNWWSWL